MSCTAATTFFFFDRKKIHVGSTNRVNLKEVSLFITALVELGVSFRWNDDDVDDDDNDAGW